MIGTEFLYGQGLGNQLFCYVTSRTLALDKGCRFGTIGRQYFGDRRYSDDGGSFFENLDLGADCVHEDFSGTYEEASQRVYLPTSGHDRKHGCDITRYDPGVAQVVEGTLIKGILQSEKYIRHRKREVCEWLAVASAFDSYEYCDDNLCIINMRGGEYVAHEELYLPRSYWLHGMDNMRKINPGMRFLVITEDVTSARRILPEVPAYHFGLAKDYITIKNARYLILSNSSFAFFPAFTSDVVKVVIAPKYWARHNVSDGYWSTAQNIYSGWLYQDRAGILASGDECMEEFSIYSRTSGIYERESSPISDTFFQFFTGLARRGSRLLFRAG